MPPPPKIGVLDLAMPLFSFYKSLLTAVLFIPQGALLDFSVLRHVKLCIFLQGAAANGTNEYLTVSGA